MTSHLQTPDDVRAFLRLCLAPRADFPGRTVTELARIMPADLVEKVAVHAPRIGALREVADLAHAAYLTALGDWITAETTAAPAAEQPTAPQAAPSKCTQNLVGQRAAPGDHHRPDPTGPCAFCQSGRTYVFNARSVNRHMKHAHDGDGRTVCPSRLEATDPMPDDQAARLPLCPQCRQTLTTDDN